jgi:hypothetical protein
VNNLFARLRPHRARLKLAAMAALALGAILLILRWGGVAQPGPLLVVGVLVFMGMMSAMAALAWWLYRSPIPGAVPAQLARSAGLYQLIVLLVGISSILSLFGAVWDAEWHQLFGSFGDDFLWPPHMLLYASFALVALFAGVGMLFLVRGASDLRRQFRADPLIGLIGLTAFYMILGVPSDQLWHALYGADLTAWSLPHVMLAACYTLIILAAMAMQLGVIPPAPWRGLRALTGRELVVAGLAGMSLSQLLLIGTIEWQGITSISNQRGDVFGQAFWDRPEWLFPAVLLAVALFCGSLVQHALRRAGVATVAGVLALILRAAVSLPLRASPAHGGGWLLVHLLALPPLVALDLWHLRRPADASLPRRQAAGALVAGALFLLVGLPAIAATMVYPRVNWGTAPFMVGIGLAAGVVASWLGANAGAALAGFHRPAAVPHMPRWVAGTALAAVVVVTLGAALYVMRAAPPVG